MVKFGCGLGKTTNFIYDKTGIYILGIDISETSIEKSKMMYPELKFQVDNKSNMMVTNVPFSLRLPGISSRMV